MKERILELLKRRKNPTDVPSLPALLGLEKSEISEMYSSLDSLIASGLVVCSKRGKVAAAERSGLLKGTFRGSAKGYGFVTLEDGTEVYIPKKDKNGAIDKDAVLIYLSGASGSGFSFGGATKEGKVSRVLSRGISSLTGTLIKARSKVGRRQYYCVVPDSRRLDFYVRVDTSAIKGARVGDKVEVKLLQFPVNGSDAKGAVTEVFGESGSLGANYAAILHSHGVRTQFSEETLKEAENVSKEEISAANRLDLRDRLIFTVDGADAKDLDDAISVEKTESGYILGVHIADVSHYVRQGGEIDKEAFMRGTSVYFADKVVPMLPKTLSNGCCSLNAGEDKYTLSAFMTLDKKGNILSTDVSRSVIRSKIRGVYSELNDVYEKKKSSPFYEKYSLLFPDTFSEVVSLCEIFEKKSVARGALDLESSECKIELDQDGSPVSVERRGSGIWEKVIEQFMICANEGVATLMSFTDTPCVYRIHQDPDPEKIRALSLFVRNAGLDERPLLNKKIRSSSLRKITDEAREKGIFGVVSRVMLRSMMKAKYSVSLSGHFGLALDRYCHFTSPIRRYPDLAVHRILKAMLDGKISGESCDRYLAFASEAAENSTETEIRAVAAERDVEDLYKTQYMTRFIGETFDGVISSVTSFGFFVELENTCEGLVRVSDLDGFFTFNEDNYTLSSGSETYSLGQSVRVVIKDVDIVARSVDMILEKQKIFTSRNTVRRNKA